MTRFLITIGLCLVASGSFAGEGDRPVQRPTLCRVEGTTEYLRCTVIWQSSYRTEARPARSVRAVPVVRQAAVGQRKIIRLPWTIGAFQ